MCRCLGKFILVILNLIVLLIGLLIVAAGVYIIFEIRTLTSFTQDLPEGIDFDFQVLDSVPYVTIAVGGVVFFIALSGCCGALTETKCLLVTYAVCMALLAAAKIVITVLVFVKLPDFTNTVERTVNDYFLSDNVAKNATFHLLESQFKCCGTFGPDAYVNEYNLTAPTCCANGTTIGDLPIDNLPIDQIPANLTAKYLQKRSLPIDISNLPIDNLSANIGDIDLGDLGQLANVTMCRREDSYETGCTTLIVNAVQSFGKAFGYGLIIVISVEVFAMAISIYLIKTIKPKKGRVLDQQPRYYY